MCGDRVSSAFVDRWTDNQCGMVTVRDGLARFERQRTPKRARHKDETGYRGIRQNIHSFYRLPNGTEITLEQLVIYLPLENLFKRGIVIFGIEDVRMFALAEYNILLSYKQTRDALYRVNHGKLLFRHIQRGVYTWEL